MMISAVWAQETAAAVAPANDFGAIIMSAFPFILVFAVFYFVLLRPQMQASKKHAALLAELKKGDVVVTDGGLIGEISALKESLVHLRLADGVVVTVAREAVRTTLTGDVAKGWEAKSSDTGSKKR